jgi:hypothetical protein
VTDGTRRTADDEADVAGLTTQARVWVDGLLSSSAAPLLFLGFAVFLTYGYEIVGYHLTLDDPVAGTSLPRAWASNFIAQGRWGMAGSQLLLPRIVVPVVPIGLGVLLSVLSWWALTRHVLVMSRWRASLAVALAVSSPILALTFSFDAIALGIGIAQVATYVFAVGVARRGWPAAAMAAAAGGLAIGCYEPYAVVLASLTLVVALRTGSWRTIWRGALLTVAAGVVAVAVRWVTQTVTGYSSDSYVSSFFDPAKLLDTDGAALVDALRSTFAALLVTPPSFSQLAPWVVLAFVALVAVAVLAILMDGKPRVLRLLALAGILVLPVLAALVTDPTPLRTMLYLPLVWIGLMTVPLPARLRDRFPRVLPLALAAVVALVVLAIASEAVVQNRVYGAGEQALDHDRALAYQIEEERARLVGPDQPLTPVVTSAVGFEWPANDLTPLVETEGLSLLGGEDWRALSFLRTQGVGVTSATPEQYELAKSQLASMPVYPQPGWLAYKDGVLLIRLTRSLK